MKYCTKCGTQCEDNTNFCAECGAPLTHSDQAQDTTTTSEAANTDSASTPVSYSYGTQDNTQSKTTYNYEYNTSSSYTATPNYNGNPNMNNSSFGIQTRSIPVAIILSIVTCGIYNIYWMIKLNDEVNILSGEPQATSGGMVFLLSFITCGIYSIYWLFKMGERCDRVKGISGNSNILYLVLGLFGFGIIAYCLMQDTINKAV